MKELIKYLIMKIPTRTIRILKNRLHKSMEWKLILILVSIGSFLITSMLLIK